MKKVQKIQIVFSWNHTKSIGKCEICRKIIEILKQKSNCFSYLLVENSAKVVFSHFCFRYFNSLFNANTFRSIRLEIKFSFSFHRKCFLFEEKLLNSPLLRLLSEQHPCNVFPKRFINFNADKAFLESSK